MSTAPCLIRPHLFSTAPLYGLPRLGNTRVRQVVLDKWFPLNIHTGVCKGGQTQIASKSCERDGRLLPSCKGGGGGRGGAAVMGEASILHYTTLHYTIL